MSSKVQKIMVQPINLIFRYLQNKQRVQIWLVDKTDMRIEGQIIGFDEFMNLVLDDAVEVMTNEEGSRRELGRLMLKGDNICVIQGVN